MKSLPVLVKVARRRIDDVSRELAQARSGIDALMSERAISIARLSHEVAMASETPAMMSMLPAFISRHKAHIDRIDNDLIAIEERVSDIRERLNEAYREKSRLETVLTHHREAAAREDAAREQAMFDEVALTRRR